MGVIVMLLILVVVIGGGAWAVKAHKPKGDEDVITVEPEPAPYQKTGVGKALAVAKPTKRYESESTIDPGQAVALPEHKIVRTWIETSSLYATYHWRCSCGVSSWSTDQAASRGKATTHCREYARAEELKAQTNGRFSW